MSGKKGSRQYFCLAAKTRAPISFGFCLRVSKKKRTSKSGEAAKRVGVKLKQNDFISDKMVSVQATKASKKGTRFISSIVLFSAILHDTR